MSQTVFVTGGLGFIGSALVRRLLAETTATVVCIDCESYAADRARLAEVEHSERLYLVKADVCDQTAITSLLQHYEPNIIYHLAAESHVDRSIDQAAPFIHSNIVGTYNLLECARNFWIKLNGKRQEAFRFVMVSTDEVFGSLHRDDPPFTPESPYLPNSPYSASKASADHLVRAWWHTYGLPTVISNCSNNYGPFQFPEKLIPLMIIKGLAGQAMPVYGDGSNRRDWLHVDDHVRGLMALWTHSTPGESYLFGGGAERSNLEVVEALCDLLDDLRPGRNSRRGLITFVTDRPGHDQRYAIDATKAQQGLGWSCRQDFAEGLRNTVQWYLSHESWWSTLMARSYKGDRLGLEVERL